jgi:hypothetical protein
MTTKLGEWNELGSEMYAAQAALERSLILASRQHGKRSAAVKRIQRLILALNRERTRFEDVAAQEGHFDPPAVSSPNRVHRRAGCPCRGWESA